jgi:hypothetical protein
MREKMVVKEGRKEGRKERTNERTNERELKPRLSGIITRYRLKYARSC